MSNNLQIIHSTARSHEGRMCRMSWKATPLQRLPLQAPSLDGSEHECVAAHTSNRHIMGFLTGHALLATKAQQRMVLPRFRPFSRWHIGTQALGEPALRWCNVGKHGGRMCVFQGGRGGGQGIANPNMRSSNMKHLTSRGQGSSANKQQVRITIKFGADGKCRVNCDLPVTH